ncbi:hypothetical protein FW415_20835 [Chitinophaga sp. XS-30]|nr:hypothetical protein FW415_20835 [Chitinophaga sp. XS-30]
MQRSVYRKRKILHATLEAIIGLFILLWIYTGLNKALDLENFKVQLGRSPFIQPLAPWIALVLPVGEILLALLLVIKRTRLIALYTSFFAMALFTGYVFIMLRYSYDLPCSCGGVLEALSWENHLIFNFTGTILAAVGIFLQIGTTASKSVKSE